MYSGVGICSSARLGKGDEDSAAGWEARVGGGGGRNQRQATSKQRSKPCSRAIRRGAARVRLSRAPGGARWTDGEGATAWLRWGGSGASASAGAGTGTASASGTGTGTGHRHRHKRKCNLKSESERVCVCWGMIGGGESICVV